MYEYLDRRYALALYEVAEKNGKVDEYLGDLREICELIDKDEEFQEVIKHPQISTKQKKRVFINIFKGKIDEENVNSRRRRRYEILCHPPHPQHALPGQPGGPLYWPHRFPPGGLLFGGAAGAENQVPLPPGHGLLRQPLHPVRGHPAHPLPRSGPRGHLGDGRVRLWPVGGQNRPGAAKRPPVPPVDGGGGQRRPAGRGERPGVPAAGVPRL